MDTLYTLSERKSSFPRISEFQNSQFLKLFKQTKHALRLVAKLFQTLCLLRLRRSFHCENRNQILLRCIRHSTLIIPFTLLHIVNGGYQIAHRRAQQFQHAVRLLHCAIHKLIISGIHKIGTIRTLAESHI